MKISSFFFLLSSFFLINLANGQCIDEADDLPFSCAWNPSTCTSCCVSSSNGTCDFYFYCGDPVTGHECDIYMICQFEPACPSSFTVNISSWDDTYDDDDFTFSTSNCRAIGVFTRDLSGNTNGQQAQNVHFIVNPGLASAEGADYNFNCQ